MSRKSELNERRQSLLSRIGKLDSYTMLLDSASQALRVAKKLVASIDYNDQSEGDAFRFAQKKTLEVILADLKSAKSEAMDLASGLGDLLAELEDYDTIDIRKENEQ